MLVVLVFERPEAVSDGGRTAKKQPKCLLDKRPNGRFWLLPFGRFDR